MICTSLIAARYRIIYGVGQCTGFVCQTGKQHGIPTPFNDKVVEIVTKIEQNQLPLAMENVELFPEEWFTYPL